VDAVHEDVVYEVAVHEDVVYRGAVRLIGANR
jgi:hypothetical protein